MLKFLLLSAIVPMGIMLSLSSVSMATIYTIAPNGDDEAACTAQAACVSIRRVSDLLVAGDTLDVQAEAGNAWLQQVMRQASRDLGQMRGGLLQNAGDKRPLGFLRLAMTWSTTLRPQFPSVAKAMPMPSITPRGSLPLSIGIYLLVPLTSNAAPLYSLRPNGLSN